MRQVQSRRFLIGASERCDLRLGGEGMPALHTMIVVDDADIWLEALAMSPTILVNERPVTAWRIADGDRIAIGTFEFVARRPKVAAAAVSLPEPAIEPEELPTDDLSISELIERIEAATDLVEDFEGRQRLGMEALLNAVDERAQSIASESPSGAVLPIGEAPPKMDGRTFPELESLVVQISGIVSELEKRSGTTWRRDTGYLDAVSALFETQDRLSRQLEFLLRRVASLNAEWSHREPGRAIA